MRSFLTSLKNRFTKPYDRPLTDNEKRLANSMFGKTLDVQKVRLKTAWWVLKGYAVAPNGNVYFHKADWQDDFALQGLGGRAWLIHELTHAWQYQQGMAVFWRALFNRKYSYRFERGKPFLAYGIEQQAKMVEDFYIRREQCLDCTEWERCIVFLKWKRCHFF